LTGHLIVNKTFEEIIMLYSLFINSLVNHNDFVANSMPIGGDRRFLMIA
jgi:hypothetical protein